MCVDIQTEGEQMSGVEEGSEGLPVYRIIRFSEGTPGGTTTREDLTLDEAQEHCGREDTHGAGWFDGYDYMRGMRPRSS